MKLINLINRTLNQESTKGVKKKRSYFYISEAGKTPYEIFKNMIGYNYVSPRMKRVFDNGIQAHERIIKYLLKQGVVRGIEVKIKNKLFRGRADAIIFSDGRIAVLEIKSMKKEDYEKMKKYCNSKTYLQTQLYMHFLKINDGIILVECKDDQRLKEFYIKRKLKVAREQFKYFSRLKSKFVQTGVMVA